MNWSDRSCKGRPLIRGSRLDGPGTDDVFVAGAENIAGITNSADLARRLTFLDDAGKLRSGFFTVIEFDNPGIGLTSPVFRTNPGFLQGGYTRGGCTRICIAQRSSK
jgi:Novel toxin 10